jgi:hypothetical protein
MNAVIGRNLAFLAVFFAPHIILGFYASYDGGSFAFGFTAPERYAYHVLSGDEARFSVGGSAEEVAYDLCLQRCAGCPLRCFDPSVLALSNDGGYVLRTAGGEVLAREGDAFRLAVIEYSASENATFRCWDGECGFDVDIGGNQTYSSALSGRIRSS